VELLIKLRFQTTKKIQIAALMQTCKKSLNKASEKKNLNKNSSREKQRKYYDKRKNIIQKKYRN